MRAKPAPTPIPLSALTCPFHEERLDPCGVCMACVRAGRVEMLSFAAAFLVTAALVALLVSWVRP